MPMSIPPDPIRDETGYIMRRSKMIWGQARFDPVRAQWWFLPQPPLPDVRHEAPSQTHLKMTANMDAPPIR
jgi:hypothetical protein